MARKTPAVVETREAEPVISIPIDDAKQIFDLFKNVALADSHFHTCQAQNFRQHIQCVYKASNVDAAYNRLKTALEAAGEGV